MKQQVIHIHGGSTFESYEQYLTYLKTTEVDIDKFKYFKDWGNSLGEALGENYEVLNPRMPNGKNARYLEWKIWWERLIPFLTGEPILIGHSLGGIFLAKYLAENQMPMKIKATILIAAPFDDETDEPLADFKLAKSLELLAKQGGQIYLMQSKDDRVVPFGELAKYQHELPQAKSIIFEDKGHFKLESFPELVELITSLL